MAVILSCTLNTAHAQKTNNAFNWDDVIEAIIQVESNSNPKAKNGQCVGLMQISPILVKECNLILKRRHSAKRYTLNDRYNKRKSTEMFILIQSEYNKDNSIERAIKSWNGGIHYKDNRKVRHYYQKVMSHMS